MLSIPISGELVLRTYAREDAQALFLLIDQNRMHLRPWFSWVDATLKQENSLEFIETCFRHLDEQSGLSMGIFYNRTIIGGLGMYQWDHTLKKAKIGYWISREYEGKGIISLCLRPFIDFLFSKLSLNKIEIHFIPGNKRSAAIAKKFGAKTEGVLRDNYLLNGKLEDLVIAGILKREWGEHTNN